MPSTFKTEDRVYETSVTTGTGSYALDGAPTGYQAFSSLVADNYCPYFATDGINWEAGIGQVLASPARLSRTAVISSSNADAAVDWGAGTKNIRCGFPAFMGVPRVKSKSVAGSSNVDLTQEEQRADVLILTGTLTGSIEVRVDTTPWRWIVLNNTSGSFTLTLKVSGQTGLVLGQGRSRVVYNDGTDVRDGFTDVTVSTASPPVRQSIRSTAIDSSGYNAMLSAGAGLNFNVDASPTNTYLDFAVGEIDYTAVLTADETNQGSLVARNTNFIYADYATVSSVTWGSTLIPPQYGNAFDRAQGAILNFEAADGSTSFIDDFGNSWSGSGNAQVDTAQFKFGAAALLLDGTGDFIDCTAIPHLGGGSWTIECFVRWNTLPSGTNEQMIFNFGQDAARAGIALSLFWNSGTPQLFLRASSDGSTDDITTTGVNIGSTPVTGTWYHVAVTYDALSGHYRTYWEGAAKHAVSSSASVCAIGRSRIGGDIAGSLGALNGWVDGFRFLRACLYPNGTTFTPPAAAPAITDHKVHFFSVPAMRMYEATAASSAGGTNPTLTARTRLFVGEQDTDASAVTATRNYAMKGLYTGPLTAATVATVTSFSHNLGVPPKHSTVMLVCQGSDSGHKPGDEIPLGQAEVGVDTNLHNIGMVHRRNVTIAAVGNNSLLSLNPTDATRATLTAAKWKYRLELARGF